MWRSKASSSPMSEACRRSDVARPEAAGAFLVSNHFLAPAFLVGPGVPKQLPLPGRLIPSSQVALICRFELRDISFTDSKLQGIKHSPRN